MADGPLGRLPLGTPIPLNDKHAILLALPTWKGTLDFVKQKPSLINHLLSGYPRDFIHTLIRELAADLLLEAGAKSNEDCVLFPIAPYADECKAFFLAQSPQTSPLVVRQLRFSIRPRGCWDGPSINLHAVVYPNSLSPTAEQFWNLTGFGISSRLAERCLNLRAGKAVEWNLEETAHLATAYKHALRSRIANLLVTTDFVSQAALDSVRQVHKDDVFLYPTGMTAIWDAYQLVMKLRPGLKSVCFGFPFADVLKVLRRWGPGCHFFGHDSDAGSDSDMAALERLLASERISALFCELPSNPVLRSPRLDRLRVLADKYDFLIVLDDTVGSFANIDALDYVDIVATSLTKWFSGYANLLAGSIAFNPRMRHYEALKAAQIAAYVDGCYDEDIIVLERNSREFLPLIRTTNANAEALCEFLHSRSLEANPTDKNFVIKKVFYPKWVTRESYDICRRRHYPDGRLAHDNFGGLFSLTFVSDLAAHTFYDDLHATKGPSFGTVFTLVCPYVVLAHWHELEWAAKFGVEERLVRVSVGTECLADLLADFGAALKKAEAAERWAHW